MVIRGTPQPLNPQGAGQCGLVFCCVPYVQVSEVCMSGLCRPVHPVRACLGKFLARCRTGVRSPAAAHAENVHPWASDVLHQGQAVHAEGVAVLGRRPVAQGRMPVSVVVLVFHGGEDRVADQPERTGSDGSGALGLVDPDPPRSAHRQLRWLA